jgi:hypothetical protein
MLATYYGSLASLSNPANGLGSPAVAVGTAIDTLDGANVHPATSGIFGVRYALCGAARRHAHTLTRTVQLLWLRQEHHHRIGDMGVCCRCEQQGAGTASLRIVAAAVTWRSADAGQVWVNGGAVAFSACFTSAACGNTVSAVRQFQRSFA